MPRYGLIGYPLGHSFSARYFAEKFAREGLSDCTYELYELPAIEELPRLLAQHPDLRGLNVTIPYKKAVIPYLHELSPEARAIGAVNTIRIEPDGHLSGFNTDWIGFRDELLHLLPPGERPAALVLGTGGSAQAVAAALDHLGICFRFVSRTGRAGALTYADISPTVLAGHLLLINATPLGMHPHTGSLPPLPYEALTPAHCLFDLVYNPPLTAFLERGAAAGATTRNGLGMLHGQAEAAWRIWQSARSA